MEELRNYLHFPVEFLYGFVAIIGGVARYLNGYVNGEKFKFRIFAASAFVAGFSGYMFATIGENMNMPAPFLFTMAGVGGFFGEQTMKLVVEYVTAKTNRT